MVAFVGFDRLDDLVNAEVIFDRSRMQLDLFNAAFKILKTMPILFKAFSTDDPMDPVAFLEQKLGKVTAVLSGYTCN